VVAWLGLTNSSSTAPLPVRGGLGSCSERLALRVVSSWEKGGSKIRAFLDNKWLVRILGVLVGILLYQLFTRYAVPYIIG